MSVHKVSPLGDRAVLVEFSAANDSAALVEVHGFCRAVNAQCWPFVQDLVPAFSSVCIHYDPLSLLASGQLFLPWLSRLADLPFDNTEGNATRIHSIPVCYAPAFAEDLAELAEILGCSQQQIIQWHRSAAYRVAMIGFAPGFPYLTGLPAALQVPRRATPRISVAAGSVAVAENLCGIYPAKLPGGWHILGRTPVSLFDPRRPAPCLLQHGDQVRFYPIEREQFEDWPAC